MIERRGGTYAIRTKDKPMIAPQSYLSTEDPYDPLLERLRQLLNDLSASDLAKIGVTIKREEGEWTWLRDAFTVALEREGREKAAATIRGNDMTKSCSIGVSKSFLIELAKLLDERNGDDGKVERMRAACIAEVRAQQRYEASDFPVCNSIVHSIESIDAGLL